ncbi:hypothetical protein [Candidatus Thiosymbion oneisti]|uniref:hypothetical protein n=1 Tax=Candidatus Thiosymbion oneisti TaxID=589554 RepID=UPI001FB1A135|nr:hypothetical protein [Candidatus Thiosymbion oneisti]
MQMQIVIENNPSEIELLAGDDLARGLVGRELARGGGHFHRRAGQGGGSRHLDFMYTAMAETEAAAAGEIAEGEAGFSL